MLSPVPRFAVALLLFTVLAAPSFAAVELVTNGGFETGDFSGWTLSGPLGWTRIAAGPGWVHSGFYAANIGTVGSESYIAQDLATTPGATYQLSFWPQNDYWVPGSGCDEFTVWWDGSLLLDWWNFPAFAYTEYTYRVTASSSSTPLEFGFRQDPAWFQIDDISVQATIIPEPASFIVWSLIGGLSIGGAWLRRRRQAA